MSDPTEPVEFDAETRQYRARYDPQEMTASVAVADVLRAVFDDDPARKPLYDVVDPEALDRLLESDPKRDRHGPRSVSFHYRNALVTVASDGRIVIGPDLEVDC